MQTVDVIFKKPFNAIPTIVCTLKSGSNITTYGDLTAFVDYGSVTKKGFTIKVSNSCATLGAKPCVSWIATVLWNSNATSDKALLHGIGSNTWVEIVTFSYTTWNISSLLVAFGEDIYSVKYGVDASRNYIDRCDAVNMNKQNAGMKVGFKVSNNVLHIYIKVERSVQLLQIQILAYYSENEPYVFLQRFQH